MSTSTDPDGREHAIPALRELLLEVHEKCLQAQLLAVRKLRGAAVDPQPAAGRSRRRKGQSQVDLAEDILKKAGGPLHLSEIIARIAAGSGRVIDPESLVSALSKRIARKDRFRRTGRNTFALI